MILAVDVGGTHADGVLLRKTASDGEVELAASVKVLIEKTDIEGAVLQVVEELLQGLDPEDEDDKIERAVISTTLTTNALAQGRESSVGLILLPGPGLGHEYCHFGDENFVLPGYVDHRGRVVQTPSRQEVVRAGRELAGEGLENVAVVGKFSVRNPDLEEMVREGLEELEADFKVIVCGHELSASLNFPRRAATACCHAAVSELHESFRDDIMEVISPHLESEELHFLKSDGGTMSGDELENSAVRAVKSGPAASILGAMSGTELQRTGFIVDTGGTTTDISLFMNGEPLFEPEGVRIKSWNTLIRGLFSRSVPVGGDSVIRCLGEGGALEVGPERRGPPAALGGPCPTPTDALLMLGELEGDFRPENFDLARVEAAMQELAAKCGTGVEEAARRSLEQMAAVIAEGCRKILKQLEGRPVHTIAELLEDISPEPEIITGLGGPAASIIPRVAAGLDLRCEILPHAPVANAIGAGCARPTVSTTVRVDTEREKLTVPRAGISRSFDKGESFDREAAEELAVELTEKRYGRDPEAPVEIISSEVFPTVSGFRTTGEIMEITAQIKPGLKYRLSGKGGDNHAQN